MNVLLHRTLDSIETALTAVATWNPLRRHRYGQQKKRRNFAKERQRTKLARLTRRRNRR